MKINALLTILPIALAVECDRNAGCAGCGQIARTDFVASGNSETATIPNWGSMSMTDKTVSVKNTSKKWALFCVYGSICVPLGAGDSCTTARQPLDRTFGGLAVWSK